MANHVQFSINFFQMNEEATAKWNEIRARMDNNTDDNNEHWFGDMWVDGQEGSPTSDDVRQYSWTTGHIGPKWCYVEEHHEEGMYGYAAWAAPEMGLEWILGQLSELDEKMITSFTYEDEMPNFIGAYVYEGNECVDGVEDDYSDLCLRAERNYEELSGKFDEDTEEWEDEEAEDFFRDEVYELINEVQQNIIDETIRDIQGVKDD